MKVLISTGEVSGDVAGAQVAREVFRRDPAARIYGIGGARLEQAGVDLEYATIHLGTVGVSESLAAIPGLVRAIARIRRRVAVEKPDIALLIGNDIFNVILGRWLRTRGIRTISWFPPQIWIWRSLAWQFAKSFDVVLASFPDEQRVYEKHCARTSFVGHYLADRLTAVTPLERVTSRARLGIDPAATVVGILPGSRRQEVNGLTKPFIETAALLAATRPIHFLIPVSDPCFAETIREEISRRAPGRISVIDGQSHDVMRASDALLTASGTATLEATLLGIPMVVAYRVSAFTLFIVRLAIRAGLMDDETTALPNLVLRRHAVTELKQRDVAPARMAAEIERVLDDPFARRKMLRDLSEAAAQLRSHDSVGLVADELFAGAASAPSPLRRATASGSLEEPARES